jgi:hypothetical protein
MKRKDSAGKDRIKLSLDKQAIREIKPADLEVGTGAWGVAAKKPGMEPC